jgi:hypothetical protein
VVTNLNTAWYRTIFLVLCVFTVFPVLGTFSVHIAIIDIHVQHTCLTSVLGELVNFLRVILHDYDTVFDFWVFTRFDILVCIQFFR